MLIVYYSLTGNVRRFVEKTGRPAKELTLGTLLHFQPFIIVTPTTGIGEVPSRVVSFLRMHGGDLHGVAASGNRNFGSMYANAADVISAQYNVPIIHRFELAGTDEDVRKFNEEVTRIDEETAR